MIIHIYPLHKLFLIFSEVKGGCRGRVIFELFQNSELKTIFIK